MNPVVWFGVVFAGYVLALLVLRAFNKDTKGALIIVTAIYFGALILFQVAGCTVSRERAPWLEAGMAYEFSRTVGSNPACVVRIRQPVGFGPLEPDWLVLGYQHISSCVDQLDKATIDQVEIMAKIPLGRPR